MPYKPIWWFVQSRRRSSATKNALFVSRNKTRLTTRAVENIVQKAVRQAGLDPKYSPHKLRHTAATLMLNHGVDIRTLQDVLGHENLGTTQIYTHISDANMKQAVEAKSPGPA